jgi:hypothetical protein
VKVVVYCWYGTKQPFNLIQQILKLGETTKNVTILLHRNVERRSPKAVVIQGPASKRTLQDAV